MTDFSAFPLDFISQTYIYRIYNIINIIGLTTQSPALLKNSLIWSNRKLHSLLHKRCEYGY